MPLNDLKTQAGLSNKKWDKSIKELTKNKLAEVEKTDDGLFVELVYYTICTQWQVQNLVQDRQAHYQFFRFHKN